MTPAEMHLSEAQFDTILPTPYVYGVEVDADENRESKGELLAIAKGLECEKAPDPDGFLNKILRVAIAAYLNVFRAVLMK